VTTNEPVSNIVHRPGSVTLVVVLTIISGILTLLGGLFLLLLGGAATLDRLNVSGGAVLFFGILYLILGISRSSSVSGSATDPGSPEC
jgi:uncharacterized protein YhhL (DUF1145 family)